LLAVLGQFSEVLNNIYNIICSPSFIPVHPFSVQKVIYNFPLMQTQVFRMGEVELISLVFLSHFVGFNASCPSVQKVNGPVLMFSLRLSPTNLLARDAKKT